MAITDPNERIRIRAAYDGETREHTIPEWSDLTGIKEVTLRYRWDRRWPPHKILREVGDDEPGLVPLDELIRLVAKERWDIADYRLFVRQVAGDPDVWPEHEKRARCRIVERLLGIGRSRQDDYLHGRAVVPSHRRRACAMVLLLDLVRDYAGMPDDIRDAVEGLFDVKEDRP